MASEALLALLRDAEGWEAKPYRCPAGYPTIGFGHRIPSMEHHELTPAEGETLLAEDVATMEAAVLKICPMLIGEPQPRIDAMVDFAFNLGPHRIHNTTLEKRIAVKDWLGAAAQLRRWVYATVDGKATRLPGLVKRRERAAKWMSEGVV